MVCSDPPRIRCVPIADAVDQLRTVPPNGDDVMTARALGICLGDTPGYADPFGVARERSVDRDSTIA